MHPLSLVTPATELVFGPKSRSVGAARRAPGAQIEAKLAVQRVLGLLAYLPKRISWTQCSDPVPLLAG